MHKYIYEHEPYRIEEFIMQIFGMGFCILLGKLNLEFFDSENPQWNGLANEKCYIGKKKKIQKNAQNYIQFYWSGFPKTLIPQKIAKLCGNGKINKQLLKGIAFPIGKHIFHLYKYL